MRWYAAWSTHTRAPARANPPALTRAVCVCGVATLCSAEGAPVWRVYPNPSPNPVQR